MNKIETKKPMSVSFRNGKWHIEVTPDEGMGLIVEKYDLMDVFQTIQKEFGYIPSNYKINPSAHPFVDEFKQVFENL